MAETGQQLLEVSQKMENQSNEANSKKISRQQSKKEKEQADKELLQLSQETSHRRNESEAVQQLRLSPIIQHPAEEVKPMSINSEIHQMIMEDELVQSIMSNEETARQVARIQKQSRETKSLTQVPSISGSKPNNHASLDIGIDWFHFETRIRKVILEVVDPLTRKQFQCFEVVDELRKLIQLVQGKGEETVMRLEKVIKRNESIDHIERKIRDTESELVLQKALMRNEQIQVSEKMETLSQRLKVAQSDVASMSRFEDKIKKVQLSIYEVTDEYNETVTARLKEVTAAFIKQVQEVDQRHREQQRDMQEVLVKLDSVRDFTNKNGVRFDQMQILVNELRETFEDSMLTLSRPQAGENSVRDGETQEQKLKNRIVSLEKQIEEFRDMQAEIDNEIRNNLHSMTINRIEQLIFQNQLEMFDKVFSVKQFNLHNNRKLSVSPDAFQAGAALKKKKIHPMSLSDFQVQLQANFKFWRDVQLEKGRFDHINNEGYHQRRKSTTSGLNATKSESSSIGGANPNQMNDSMLIMDSEQSQLLMQQKLLLTRSSIDSDEKTKKYLKDLQIIDQVTMLVGSRELLQPMDQPQKKNSIDETSPKMKGTKSLASTVQISESESKDDNYDGNRRDGRVQLPQFLKELDEHRLSEIIKSHLEELKKDIDKKLQDTVEELTQQMQDQAHKLSHNPLLTMIGRNRHLLENLNLDVTKLKDELGTKASLTHHLQKIEMSMNLWKNDIYQQIYKMKELDEQMFMKQIEFSDKLDYELIKLRKKDEEIIQNVEKHKKDLQESLSMGHELGENLTQVAKAVCHLVELEAVTSALEQQDEIDRKNRSALPPQQDPDGEAQQESQQPVAYEPSAVNFFGHSFKRQNLIYCRRIQIETLIIQHIATKKIFLQALQNSANQVVNADTFRLNLVSRLKMISDEFQVKVDALAQELQKQIKMMNAAQGIIILPKEIQRIKELHQITPDSQKQQKHQSRFVRNQSRENTQKGVIRETNQVLYSTQPSRNIQKNQGLRQNATYNQSTGLGNPQLSMTQDQHQIRQMMNQSMMEVSQNQQQLMAKEEALSKSDSRLKQIQGGGALILKQRAVNVGNVEYLPRHMQPIKPTSLLNQYNGNSSGANNKRQAAGSVPAGSQIKGSEAGVTQMASKNIQTKEVSHHSVARSYKPREMRQANLLPHIAGGGPSQQLKIPTLQPFSMQRSQGESNEELEQLQIEAIQFQVAPMKIQQQQK